MQKISITNDEPQLPANGLAIDESLLPKPGTTPGQKVIVTGGQSSDQKGSMKSSKSIASLIIVVAIVAGVGTGYGVHQLKAGGTAGQPVTEDGTPIKTGSPTGDVKVGDVYGSANESIFKDSTEGVIQAGGIDGEGSHNLVRPGGKSQTVYLTSTSVDLDKFVGHKIKIWGETFAAQKAGWLMDVGRIQVLELNAELPVEKK